MKTLFIMGSILLALALVVFGVWFCLYGGIVSIITALQQNPVNAANIAWGAIRIILIIPCTWSVALLFMFGIVGLTQ